MFKHIQLVAFALCALLVIPTAAQVPSYVPTDGLVGWWPFNGNANDESGNGNDGVVNGATLTEDRSGNVNSAYYFSGSGCQTRIDFSINTTSIQTGLTISIWVNKSGDGCIGPRLLEFWPGEWGPAWSQWNWDNSNYTNFGSTLDNGAASYSSFEVRPNGIWTNLTYTHDGSTGKFYQDGALINSVPSIGNPILAGDLALGRMNHPAYDAFNGKFDDIAIYNRALTSQEIQNLYIGTTQPPCVSLPSNLQQGLVGYWPFCGNANDESGNGNDGVVNGATLTEDRFGNANAAYGFDGVDDFISIQDAASLSLNGDFTISAWKLEDPNSSNGYHSIVTKRLVGDWGYNLAVSKIPGGSNQENDKLITGRRNNGGAQTEYRFSNQTTDDNVWQHVLITVKNDTIKFYIDGLDVGYLETFGNTFTIPMQNQLVGLTIGDCNCNNNEEMQGLLDDIGIWNRALTPEEVQELYTLDACTFTVYDTLTVYETVYDTVYTYETIYDTVTTFVTVTDTLLIDITFTGIEGQPSWLNTVTVFPNPASDHITIDYGNFALMAGYNTIITDAAGATVYSSAVSSQQVDIDINAWGATGVYYMSMYDANGELVAVRHIVLE